MPDEILDVTTADSSTATSATATADTTAGSQNTGQADANGQPQYKSFHEHPDWQRREQTWQRRLEQRDREWERRFQEHQRQPQTTPRQPTLEQQEALRALRELQSYDPESARDRQELAALRQEVSQLRGHYQSAFTQQGRGELARMAGEIGLPNDAKSLRVIENAVTVYLADNPDAVQRFQAHDASVLKDAFKEFNDTFVSKLRRENAAATAQTKTQMLRTVPPRPAGSQSGPVAPPKLEAGKEREHMAALHKQAGEMLERATGR